jgi:hypothetical protein
MVVDAPARRAASPARSLSWLTARLEHFAPGSPGVPRETLAKRCTELGLVTAYLRAWVADGSLPAQPFARHADAWREALHARCQAAGEARIALEDGGRSLYHAQPYLWLRAGGYRVRSWERVLAGLSRRGARPRSVGVLHCLWKAGLAGEPDWHEALKRWLTVWGDQPAARDRDAYRISHAAFYITDFGCQAPPVARVDRDRLEAVAVELLGRALAQERWDLVGELLIALACLDRQDPLQESAARAFEERWRPDGGAGDPVFRRHHHTVMVDVLRCAVAGRHIRRPRATDPRTGS